MKCLLSLLICCLFYSHLIAQDLDDHKDLKYEERGYVITHHNDTIVCQIRPGTKKWSTYYQKKYYPLNVDTLKSFYLIEDSAKFVVKRIPEFPLSSDYWGKDDYELFSGKKIFIEEVVKGKISLYELFIPHQGGRYPFPELFWYASKDNGDIIEISSGKYAGDHNLTIKDRMDNFMALIADDEHLYERFKEATKAAQYSNDLVQYYIKTYNEDYLEAHPPTSK